MKERKASAAVCLLITSKRISISLIILNGDWSNLAFLTIFSLDWQVSRTLAQLTDKVLDRGLVLLEAKESGNLGCLWPAGAECGESPTLIASGANIIQTPYQALQASLQNAPGDKRQGQLTKRNESNPFGRGTNTGM